MSSFQFAVLAEGTKIDKSKVKNTVIIISYPLYIMKDSKGKVDWTVSKNAAEPVSVSGLTNNEGIPVKYVGEAYKLPQWCEEHNIQLVVEYQEDSYTI